MPRTPKPKPIGTRAPGGGSLPADTSEDQQQQPTDDERLDTLLKQLGDVEGYSVRVERVRDPGMRVDLAGYLGILPLSTDLYDDVAQAWGGGRYKARVFRGQEYKAFLQFAIAGEPRPREAREQGAAAVAEPESETNKLLRQLIAKMDAPPPVSPLAQLAEAAKVLKELQPTPPAPERRGSTAEMFELFNSMLDLRRRVADESEPRNDDGIGAIVREGIVPLVSLVRERMEQEKNAGGGNGQAPKTRQLTSGAPATQRVASSSPPDDPVARLFSRIPVIGRSYLAGAARAKKDPALYAELVLDQLPQAEYDLLPDLLSMQDFVPRLLATVKEFEPFPVWFTELAKAMHASVMARGELVDLEPVDEIEAVHAENGTSSPGAVHATPDPDMHATAAAAGAES